MPKTRDTKTPPAKPKRLGSVQRNFVGARTVSDDLLVITAPNGGSAYVAVLEVGGITYDLKSDAEQVRLNELYRLILCGLNFDVQLLWRSQPLRLEPYLQRFQMAEREQPTIWNTLAESHVGFLNQLAGRRTLLTRQAYLVVRFEPADAINKQVQNTLFGGKPPKPAEAMERARQELNLRLAELMRRLEILQLSARRLSGLVELAHFYQSCLQPLAAAQFPLAPEVLESVDLPSRRLSHVPTPVLPVLLAVCSTCQATTPTWASYCGNCGTPFSVERWTRFLLPRADAAQAAPQGGKGEPQRKGRRAFTFRRQQREPPGRRTLFPQLADLLAPDQMEVGPDYIRIGDEYHRVLAITGMPRSVGPGWLRSLMELDEPFELCFHLHPRSSADIDRLFRRKQTVVKANYDLATKHGTVMDAHMLVAHEDLEELSRRVASGEERMFDVVWLLRVWGASKRELNERTGRIQNVLYTSLLAHRRCAYEQAEALRTCLPHGRKHLQDEGLLLSGEATSTTFPFIATSFFHEEGVLEGITPTGELIVLDPWAVQKGITNANRVVFGPPGQGKSHYVKTTIMRQALRYQYQAQDERLRFQIFVVDPDREYGRIAQGLGGQIVRLAPGSADCINPFDLPQVRRDKLIGEGMHGDYLADHVQRLHALLEIMLANRQPDGSPGTLTEAEDSLIDLALYETYKRAGVTRDPSTHHHAAPLLSDLAEVLASQLGGEDKTGLLPRLRRFVDGSLSGLFRGATTLRVDSPIVVFDTHECETDIQQIIALFLVSNFVWGQTFQSTIPRQLIVDEAASLVQYRSGKRFLEDLVRRARKNFLGVTTITQHPSTFANSTIIANSAIKVLMRPDPVTLELISQMFKLSEREGSRILRLKIGEGLLIVGDQRMIVQFETSELEHLLATTNPSEIAEWLEKPGHAHLRTLLSRLAEGSGIQELATSLVGS
jgi:hypothetical protein